jgi:L-threonate 2-dehydrogenase
MHIGVLGLGIMGGAMSANMVKAGLTVTGFDPAQEAMAAFVAAGGRAARSAREVAKACEIVITSLPSASALDASVGGENGLAAAGKAGLLIVETSTLPIAVKERARAAAMLGGMIMLDCPISGTGAQAKNKDLSMYASGDRAAYERCIDLFKAFARSWFYLGEFGNGSKMKFIANLLVSTHNVAAAEAMVMGEQAGLSLQQVYNVIRDGAGNSRMFEVRGPMMVAGCYEPATMKIDIWQKDIDTITAFARDIGAPTPTFDAASGVYAEALVKGMAKLDTAATCQVLEARAGRKR